MVSCFANPQFGQVKTEFRLMVVMLFTCGALKGNRHWSWPLPT